MGEKSERASIIDSISNWIKLLALIVLVAEVVILLAMNQTPVESSIYPWYPFMMFFLLLIIIVAVFTDRYMERQSKKLTIPIEGNELTVNTAKNKVAKILEETKSYTSSLLGYSFDEPKGDKWAKAKKISYKELLQQTLLIEDINDEHLKATLSANNIFGNLLYHANIVEIHHGNSSIIEMNNASTTESVEHIISKNIELKAMEGIDLTEEEINQLRQELNQTDNYSKIGFSVKLNVTTFDKKNNDINFINSGLPNFFFNLSMASREPIDSLTSNEHLILWSTSNKLKNVVVNGEQYQSFYIYRLYQLVQNEENIYLCQVQWSPQMKDSIFTWESLKKSFESFKIKQ